MLKMKKSFPKWKPVEITGSLLNPSEDLDGFVGLEVLENYDSSFLTGHKKPTDFPISDLEGDIYDGRKRKNTDFEDVDDDKIEEKSLKKTKKKKTKADEEHFPGQFVLLNKPQDAEEDKVDNVDGAAITAAWNEIGVLSEEITRSLVEMKFSSPTKIQRESIPVSVFGKCDILGAAPTGSGKTLAFGIPIVQSVQKILSESDSDTGNLYSVILTPTRELAQQIHKHLKEITKYTQVSIACIIGGLAQVKQERLLKLKPHIVIGTPGRVWELVKDGNEHLQKIDSVRFFVVDETDRMAEKGHFTELEEILKLLNCTDNKSQRQNFVFSATLTMLHDLSQHKKKSKIMTKEQRLNEFVTMFGMKDPKVFDVTSQSGMAAKLLEARILCELGEKDFHLYYIIINHPGRTIVFCNSIECVKRIASVLSHLNITPVMLHGKMEQKQRLKNLESFQNNEDSVMVTTQVAARGLDIPNVQHVIHYQVPTTGEDYVHRSGRTARVDKEGLSILIISPTEVKFFVKLQKSLGRNEDLPIFPVDEKAMQNVRERVRLAREIEGLDLQMRRENDNRNWKKKAADDIGILDDSEDSDWEANNNRAQKQVCLAIKQKKQQLGKLLSTKIIGNNIRSLKFPIGPENLKKIEANSVEAVKQSVANKNGKGIKLFRKTKKHLTVDKRNKKGK